MTDLCCFAISGKLQLKHAPAATGNKM